MSRFRSIALLAAAGMALGYGAQILGSAVRESVEARQRGRLAVTPLQMPWLGWKDVLMRTWTEAMDDRLLSVAASVAFFALLALVPALSVLVSVYGLFTDATRIYDQIGMIAAHLPDGGRQIIEEQARRLTSQPPATLSVTLIISLAIAGWSANAAIKGVFDSLNVIYGEAEKRSFIWLNVVSLLTTFGAIALVMLAFVVIAIIPAILRATPFGPLLEWMVAVLRWPIFLVLAAMSISVLYWIGPSRRAARWPWVLPGAIAAALLWAAVSAGFSWYVSTLGDYNATYGSLSAVIVFMTWLWLSAAVILIGAEMNAELEHQTARDTTTGVPKPLGMRGAVVADHIGPAVVAE
jgi:membrane protein